MHDFITSANGILNQKILTVSGHKLSLNDIQFRILYDNYHANPLIIYGLFQGNIGSPNIRKQAYTAKNVWSSLKRNANEFINSNRGTFCYKVCPVFKISEFYARNHSFFPNFNHDVKAHINQYLKGKMKDRLKKSEQLTANIANWKIADLYGTVQKYGVGSSTNSAALLGATNNSSFNDALITKSFNLNFFTAEQVEILLKLNKARIKQTGHVIIRDE